MDDREFAESLKSCVKCGACRSVCPLYEVDLSEASVARGKIDTIGKAVAGEISTRDSSYTRFLDNCLLCGRCEEKCPNMVDTTGIFTWERSRINSEEGIAAQKRALLAGIEIMGKEKSIAQNVLKHGIKVLSSTVPHDSGFFYRLPSLIGGGKMIPAFPQKSYLSEKGEPLNSGSREDSVSLFSGCVYNFFFPSILDAVVDTIASGERGFKVSTPRDQVCCGLPALGAGDRKKAVEQAMTNVELFSRMGEREVVFPCASCLYMVKKVYPAMLRGTPLEGPAIDLAKRCVDYAHLLSAHVDEMEEFHPISSHQSVGYHRPCHISAAAPDDSEGENMLKEVFRESFVELPDSENCCGFGGTFNIVNYDKSISMGERKIKSAEKMGVDIIGTSCSGCISHLNESAARMGSAVKVVHIAELIRGR